MSERIRNNMYLIYAPDGQIRAFTRTSAVLSFDDADGDLDVLEVDDETIDANEKMVNPKTKRLNKRPANNANTDKTEVLADGIDVITLTVPRKSRVTVSTAIGDIDVEPTNNKVELTFDEPGEYLVRVQSFPEKDTELVINAV